MFSVGKMREEVRYSSYNVNQSILENAFPAENAVSAIVQSEVENVVIKPQIKI